MANERDSTFNPCHCEQYKSYIQDLGNIGTRHENTRRFYVSVMSALFVFLSLAGKEGVIHAIQGTVLLVVGIAGILLCLVWIFHMQAFRALYEAKFAILKKMEEQQGLFHAYEEEYNYLQSNPRYFFLTSLDTVSPILFILLFVAVLIVKQ